ncbi:hypothetical protein HYH02_015283 [Chlamydomonas schloesseri]|uniref:Uncharacterized protein n=1 Tax=Chlamydomonas schloesseri TaxID=2026947 RepID=A0A835SAJ7_9CHLO|nr:hypothetical protein HYH02_015283 [Chlamydomonas schloesseri]|eukprot:KAG2423743.1 hypothetical protein HYH02_015283 [Chlamydomonas schloesseri]
MYEQAKSRLRSLEAVTAQGDLVAAAAQQGAAAVDAQASGNGAEASGSGAGAEKEAMLQGALALQDKRKKATAAIKKVRDQNGKVEPASVEEVTSDSSTSDDDDDDDKYYTDPSKMLELKMLMSAKQVKDHKQQHLGQSLAKQPNKELDPNSKFGATHCTVLSLGVVQERLMQPAMQHLLPLLPDEIHVWDTHTRRKVDTSEADSTNRTTVGQGAAKRRKAGGEFADEGGMPPPPPRPKAISGSGAAEQQPQLHGSGGGASGGGSGSLVVGVLGSGMLQSPAQLNNPSGSSGLGLASPLAHLLGTGTIGGGGGGVPLLNTTYQPTGAAGLVQLTPPAGAAGFQWTAQLQPGSGMGPIMQQLTQQVPSAARAQQQDTADAGALDEFLGAPHTWDEKQMPSGLRGDLLMAAGAFNSLKHAANQHTWQPVLRTSYEAAAIKLVLPVPDTARDEEALTKAAAAAVTAKGLHSTRTDTMVPLVRALETALNSAKELDKELDKEATAQEEAAMYYDQRAQYVAHQGIGQQYGACDAFIKFSGAVKDHPGGTFMEGMRQLESGVKTFKSGLPRLVTYPGPEQKLSSVDHLATNSVLAKGSSLLGDVMNAGRKPAGRSDTRMHAAAVQAA